jgi:hypothetical protein
LSGAKLTIAGSALVGVTPDHTVIPAQAGILKHLMVN